LLFAPGTAQEYSSAGYFVLGRLMEIVSGESYPTFVQKRIFEPLGMRDSGYRPRATDADRMAAVFQEQRNVRRLLYRFNPDVRIQNDAGDGGVFSTTRDIGKFLQMFLDNDGTVLSRESIQLMHRVHRPGFVNNATANSDVSTALGFTVKDGLFMHGGSSGVMGWGDHKSGIVGVLFIQYPEDQGRGDRLRAAFRQAVQAATGGTPPPGPPPPRPRPVRVPRYEVFEPALTSSVDYANPFADVTVALRCTAPSGAVFEVAGFHDGNNTWRARFAPNELGAWKYTVRCSDETNRGLQQAEGAFTCVESRGKGFIRADPVRKYWFVYDDGSAFWGSGDTAYSLINGVSPEDRARYLRTRAAQGFNFVRVHVGGHPSSSGLGEGGDPDRFNLAHFRAWDRFLAELGTHAMRAEVILLNRYNRGRFSQDPRWTPEREERYVRYVVSRLSASTAVFLWTVANEYEVYPKGTYADPEPEDNAWAERVGALLHRIDPHRHPTTVHPWEQPLMARGKFMADRFGASPHIDVLSQQYYAEATMTGPPLPGRGRAWVGPGFQLGPKVERGFYYVGSGEGIDRVLRLDRRAEKPVINTESAYEYYAGRNEGGWVDTNLGRRQAWRLFAAGAAAHATGFEGTFWAAKLAGVPRRTEFFLEDRGLAAQLKHRYEFITQRTRFQDMAPAQALVSDGNVCLANPGKEYVVYAPQGGTITLDLSAAAGEFAVEWLNPRDGTYHPAVAVAGGARRAFVPADADDWVLHLKLTPRSP
jgi:hypothetical protein